MSRPPDEKSDAVRAVSGAGDKCSPDGPGEADALEAIYREHVGAVLGFLQAGFSFGRGEGGRGFFRVRSAFDAEEIAHDAFAAFFKQWGSGGYDRSRPPLPYILRIAANLALRRGRKGGGAIMLGPDEVPEMAAPEPEDPELRTLLLEFHGGLSAEDQAVFDAVVANELSQAKAGAELGKTRDQVYRAVVRIRQKALRFFGQRGWLDES